MLGRLIRILLGLAVLAGAADIWNPALIPQGVPVPFGDFEDLRTTAVITLAVIGAAFVLAGLVGSGRPRRASRSAPASAFALPPAHDFEGRPAAGPATLVAARGPLVLAPEAVPAALVEEPPPPRVEPAPLEETATAAWIPAAMPVLAATGAAADIAAPTAAPAPPSQPASQPPPPAASPPRPVVADGPDRTAFVAATEAGDRQRLEGRLEAAMDHYSQALDLARANLKLGPHDVQAHADLAAALTNVGDIHDAQRRLEPALAAYEESLTFHRALAAHSPNDRAAQRGLSLALEKLADTREARGHRSRALDLYRESLPIAEKLAADHPGDALLTQDLALTRERLASLEAQMT